MTAVEWLIDKLEVNKIIPNTYPGEYWNILKRGALEMEKEEKIDFADKYGTYLLQGGIMSAAAYNETFKSE